MVEREDVALIEEFEIVVCSRCGLVKSGNRWIRRDLAEVLEDMIFKKARVVEEFKVDTVRISTSSCVLRGEIGGEEVEVSIPLKFKVKRVLCQRCSRESGGYYEAVVQVRAEGRELSEKEISTVMEIAESIVSASEDQKAFITKVERKKEGVNIFFGSRNIGKRVSKQISRVLGGQIVESKTLHTRIDGRDVYRFTYSVRLPEYREGDVVEGFVLVKNVVSGKGVDIFSGKTVNIGREKVIARREEMERGVIVSLDMNAAEVLCDNGKVVITPRPFGAEIGAEVMVFEKDGRFYSFKGY